MTELKRQYVAARRFNRYSPGQSVNEAGLKLQKLISCGLVKEVKIAPPPETKIAPPPELKAANAQPKPPAKRKRRRKPAAAS